MADQDTGQEKSLEPTQRKIEKEKEKGNFVRSKEITTVAGFLAALLFLWLGQEYMIERVLRAGRFFLNFDPFLNLGPTTIGQFFVSALIYLIPIVLPLFLLVFVSGVAGETGQIGLRVLKDPFEPKWQKLNPAEGFKRIFSMKQLAEGLKSMLKMAIFGYMIYITVEDSMPKLITMTENTPAQGLRIMMDLGLKLGLRTCLLLLVLAGFDYWFQRWQYYKKLRMSHQEMKDEMKETMGDPVLKQRMRSIQMDIARKRMMQDVPDADVVLTNPTHYSVALKYDPEKSFAPVVVAKGQNYIAFRIRDIAEHHKVPIVENPPLAREIYKKVEVGKPIPAALFKAVAQILASIWHLSAKRGRNWAVQNKNQAA
ncbi:MAG: flagellar biosynthesis protein FlhB [Candidatus Sumerlaeia bacterium]